MAGEVQVPVAFQLTDALSVGAAYRLAFAQMITKVPTSATNMPPYSETELSQFGMNPLGVQVGLLYKPNSSFSFGATYRSKSAIEIKGDLKDGEGNVLMTADEMEEAGTHTYFSMPHMFKVGTAFKPAGAELTLGADFRYLMFSDSHTPRRAGAGAQWRDAIDLSMGAEYVFSEMFPARLGLSVGQSAVSKGAGGMLLFLPPPGVNIGLFLGGGVKLSMVDIDLGVGYVFCNTSVGENKTDLPGDYSFNVPMASLSGTLHM
jgi:long-subunit fatty acid transport protein